MSPNMKSGTYNKPLILDERATATVNMCRKFSELWTCGLWDKRVDRQTNRQTQRHADRNTSHP